MKIKDIFDFKLETPDDPIDCPLCKETIKLTSNNYSTKYRCQICYTQMTFFDVPGTPTGVHFELGKYRFGIGFTSQYYVSTGRNLTLKYYTMGSGQEMLEVDTDDLSEDWVQTLLAFL